MSYKNNWLKSLSESYNTNNRGQVNLSEELASQVALNEQLVDLVKALCEELDIDVETLLEDLFDKAGQEASNASVNRISDKFIQAANDPRVSKAEKMAIRMRWLDAQDKRANRFNSPTIYTAKGGRVVKKKL